MNDAQLFWYGVGLALATSSLVGVVVGAVAAGLKVHNEVRRRERKTNRAQTD